MTLNLLAQIIPGSAVTREPDGEHGVQGVLCADAYGGDDVRAGSQVGALYQGSAACEIGRAHV